MLKFYREEARRILAGPKKMSTILITAARRWSGESERKMLTGKRMGGNAGGARDSGLLRCGKAEEEGGKHGEIGI
jgi:hypothetical protein